MMIPGRTLHRLAARVCSTDTLERIVEPAIADLQKEYAGAGHFAKRNWILVTGYVAIVNVMVLCAVTVSLQSGEDRRAFVNAVTWSAAMVAMFALLLMVPPFIEHPNMAWDLAATLIPQAIGVAIPIGIAFGLAFGISGRPTVNLAKTTLAAALAVCAFCFATLAWGVPAGNDAFRNITVREMRERGYDGPEQAPHKGASEMTLSELRAEIAHFAADGEPRIARRYAFSFHLRFALAAATLSLVSLLLVVRADTRAARGAFAFAACVIYWVLMFGGEWGTRRGFLLPPFGAWLPNLVFIASSIFLVLLRPSRLRV